MHDGGLVDLPVNETKRVELIKRMTRNPVKLEYSEWLDKGPWLHMEVIDSR